MESIAMQIRLRKNARTTPAIRAEIAASSDSVATLAARLGRQLIPIAAQREPFETVNRF